MREDTARKYFFSLVDKDFKYRAVNKDVGCQGSWLNLTGTGLTKVQSVLFTGFTPVDGDLAGDFDAALDQCLRRLAA